MAHHDQSVLAGECKIKCEILTSFVPSEKVVSFNTVAGVEEVAVSAQAVLDGRFLVAHCLEQRDGTYLIELPSETTSGRWRVWVPRTEVES